MDGQQKIALMDMYQKMLLEAATIEEGRRIMETMHHLLHPPAPLVNLSHAEK